MNVQERLQAAKLDHDRQYNKRQIVEKLQRDRSFYKENLPIARRKQEELYHELANMGVVQMINDISGTTLFPPTDLDIISEFFGKPGDLIFESHDVDAWGYACPLPTLAEMRSNDVVLKFNFQKRVSDTELSLPEYDEVAISYSDKHPRLSIAGAWSEYPPIDIFDKKEAIEIALARAFAFPKKVSQF